MKYAASPAVKSWGPSCVCLKPRPSLTGSTAPSRATFCLLPSRRKFAASWSRGGDRRAGRRRARTQPRSGCGLELLPVRDDDDLSGGRVDRWPFGAGRSIAVKGPSAESSVAAMLRFSQAQVMVGGPAMRGADAGARGRQAAVRFRREHLLPFLGLSAGEVMQSAACNSFHSIQQRARAGY